LTKSNLLAYHECRSTEEKAAFESVMYAARAEGAITVTIGKKLAEEGFVSRVEVRDKALLASFIGVTQSEEHLFKAETIFAPHVDVFPVLVDVLNCWRQLGNVKAKSAENAQDWVDAIRVIDFAEKNLSGDIVMPVKEASGKLFNDTKRINKLTSLIDVLIAGDISTASRKPSEVLVGIGLMREEHPVRMAGLVTIERDRVISILDRPYSGFHAASVVRVAGHPLMVMTIENLTTFHSEARRRCNDNVLLIYTAGMPNPPWCEMYIRLLTSIDAVTPVYHWGDYDEGGFRIASVISQAALKAERVILPWKMHPDDVPEDHRCKASEGTVNKMAYFAESSGWPFLKEPIVNAKYKAEQENLC
jgi:hypothetical protein